MWSCVDSAWIPWLPWPSPATAPGGSPPHAPSAAAGWSRWCLARRWECALYSCRWRNLQPGGERRAEVRRSYYHPGPALQLMSASCISIIMNVSRLQWLQLSVFPSLPAPCCAWPGVSAHVQQRLQTCWFSQTASKYILRAHFLELSNSFQPLWPAFKQHHILLLCGSTGGNVLSPELWAELLCNVLFPLHSSSSTHVHYYLY